MELLNRFLLDEPSKKFIIHNNKLYKKNYANNKKKILIEFNNWPTFHISNSYLLSAIKNNKNCDIVAYENYRIYSNSKNSWFEKIKWHIGSFLKLKTFKIYESFGVNKYIQPKISLKIKKASDESVKKIINKLKNKQDILNLKVESIWIGDLIYDTYLKKFNKYTININDQKFTNFLHSFIDIFYFWFFYFKENKIQSVLSGHGVYISAVLLRIASHKKINSYVANEHKIYRFNNFLEKKTSQSTGNFYEDRYFKKIFKKLNKVKQKKIILNGKKISDMISKNKKNNFYTKITKSKKIHKSLISNNKIKVVIFLHAFSDSPNAKGGNLFPDFFEWLKFLNDKIILNTNYEWYVKPHPNFESDQIKFLRNFNNLSKIKIIPKDYNLYHLHKLRISFILTMFGAVGKEYPLKNIRVVHACINNPYVNFNFNLTPKSIKEYKKILLNLKENFYPINKKELYIFNYMDNIFFNRNYLIKDFDNFVNKIGGRLKLYKTNFYSIWIKNFNKDEHFSKINQISNFVASKDYLLTNKHNEK
jgi:hypothetical protein